MVSLIKYDIELKYFDVIKKILNTLPSVDAYLKMVSEDNIIEFNANIPFNHSFLNNCLILCNDLEEMLSKFNEGGLSINSGSQSKRGEVNSLNYFLSHFDIDYRNSLFYHYRHHIQKRPTVCKVEVSRNKFSFKNVHMNLGITRFYSTSSKPSILKSVSAPKDVKRQNLFLENYLLIKNILDNNNDLDYIQVQKKIESLLYNQESKFLESLP